MQDGTTLWEPPTELRERSHMARLMADRGADDYASLWQWSVDDLASFWARRARRLLPALLIVVAVIAIVTAQTAPLNTLGARRDDMIATIFYFANWHFIAAGQFRGGEQLIDTQQVKPGTLLVYLEPLYAGGLEGITPGSSCIANAYSNNHDIITAKDTGTMQRVALHAVDALALVHALILRLQALVLPFKTLVFSGGH